MPVPQSSCAPGSTLPLDPPPGGGSEQPFLWPPPQHHVQFIRSTLRTAEWQTGLFEGSLPSPEECVPQGDPGHRLGSASTLPVVCSYPFAGNQSTNI